MILVLCLHALGALTFVLAKKALLTFSPFALIALRMIGGGSLLLLYSLFYLKSSRANVSPFMLFLTGAIHIFLPFTCEFWALQYMTSVKANLMFSATPFISALCSFLFFAKRLTLRQWCGLMFGAISLLFCLVPAGNLLEIAQLGKAELVLLAGIASSVGGWLCVQQLLEKGASLPFINGWAMVIGGTLSAVLSLFLEEPFLQHSCQSVVTGSLFLFSLMVVSNIILYPLYSWLLKKYSLTFISCAGFLSPLFGFFLGYLVCGEPLLPSYFYSFGAILIGLLIFYWDEK